MAWTEEARAASAAARAANAAGKNQQQQQKKQQYQANAGNRAAFALRNQMIHDEGKGARMRAAALGAAHQGLVHTLIPGIAKAFLGIGLGFGGAMIKAAGRTRGGHGRH